MKTNIRGEVEIIGRENGKIIYYDKGPNMVTYWARHAVMHLLTGDCFALSGKKRAYTGSHSSSTNLDGTLLSGAQFFHDNAGDPTYSDKFYWIETTSTPTKIYPFMPVKMLFGTGHEFTTYPDFSTEDGLVDEWGSSGSFLSGISGNDNTYSNIFDDPSSQSGLPKKARTVNSNTTDLKTTPAITQEDVAISGAIKDGSLNYSSNLATMTENIAGTGVVLKSAYRGIGNPCFLYPKRGSVTFEDAVSQVMLTQEEVGGYNLETKLTFTVVMPEQTGSNSTAFYPYNGYTIKEVGLFSDAYLFLANDPNSYDRRMNHGLMFAKRYITPFVKTGNSSFTVRWTIYI